MRLFTADIGGRCASPAEISRAACALAAFCAETVWGVPRPEIAHTAEGKPFFPGLPGRYLSLSHTGGRLLAGLAEEPLGVDAELIRPLRPGLEERVFSPRERREFSFFEGWTARESIYKLTGRGGLTSMELRRAGAELAAPFPGVRCRNYGCIPGCMAAAACYSGDFPDGIETVQTALFLP